MNEKMLQLKASLAKKPVIAGLKSREDAERALEKQVQVWFYLTGTIFELREVIVLSKKYNKTLLAHIDLIQGIAKDPCGIQLLAEELLVDGILTTKSHLIRVAKNFGLLAIQRLFILDSEALRTGLKILQSSNPDAVEILPALILPNLVKRLPSDLPPIIGGGLVETIDELDMVLERRTLAVSTSKESLWDYQRR